MGMEFTALILKDGKITIPSRVRQDNKLKEGMLITVVIKHFKTVEETE